MRKIVVSGIIVVLTLMQSHAVSAAVDIDKAVALVEQTVPFAQQMDWQGYADFVHPDALGQFAEEMRPIMKSMYRQIASEDSTELSLLNEQFPGLFERIEAAQDLKPKEFFAATMDIIFSLIPNADMMFSSLDTEILGGLPEGDTLVHVVTRSKISMGQFSAENQMDVVTCKVYEDGYRIMLSAEFQGLANGLRQGMGL